MNIAIRDDSQTPRASTGATPLYSGAILKRRRLDGRDTSQARPQQTQGHQSPRGKSLSHHQLIMQPEAGDLSQENLITEVKESYARLVVIEDQCIKIDKWLRQGVPESQAKFNNEKWKELIKMHNELLQKHYDFFITSQHPSATAKIRHLTVSHGMLARIWQHGIHTFLELLRRHLPQSIDHMFSFIHLAYSWMALFYECVPAFEDTWGECLGDIARYGMCIESEDLRAQTDWRMVSRHWFIKCSETAPTTGRLYHHLAIVTRPNGLQKLFYYLKSLTVDIPYTCARDSILEFYAHSSHLDPLQPPAFVKCHGMVLTGEDLEKFGPTMDEFLGQLDSQIASLTHQECSHIALANCIAMHGFVSKQDALIETTAKSQIEPRTKPTTELTISNPPKNSISSILLFGHVKILLNRTFEVVLRRERSHDALPFIHVTLAYLLYNSASRDAMSLVQDGLPSDLLVALLNKLSVTYTTRARIEADHFPFPEKGEIRPLPEDYEMRGLPWTASYLPTHWFVNTNEDQRCREVPSMAEDRSERILWIACKLAKRGSVIKYAREKSFHLNRLNRPFH